MRRKDKFKNQLQICGWVGGGISFHCNNKKEYLQCPEYSIIKCNATLSSNCADTLCSLEKFKF